MSAAVTLAQVGQPKPILQLHLEPAEPIEVGEFTSAMASLGHRYTSFVERHGALGSGRNARLLVWNISPGSIDIGLLPDWGWVGLLASAYDDLKLTVEFAKALADLLDLFKERRTKENSPNIRIEDCDDAINIAGPIANHGGQQTVNVVNAGVYMPVLFMTSDNAKGLLNNATLLRKELAQPEAGKYQRVALIWTQLNRGETRTKGLRSPDKATIEDIDPDPKPVFFNDEVLYLKQQMIGDEVNPYTFVYFVDVNTSVIQGKIVGYRILDYHGKDQLHEE